MFEFVGLGHMYVNPIAGNQAPNPTAMGILGLQSASVDIDQKFAELKGSNKGPDDVATTDMTVKGKIEMARMDTDLFNQVYFAETTTTNAPIIVPDEAATIPATPGPYTVTVTGSATWTKDLGVRYTNGQPLIHVASVTAPGEYSVAAGVYTFNSGDQAKTINISYEKSSTAGTLLTVHNQKIGYGPIVEVFMWEDYSSVLNQSTNNGIHLFACRFGKLSHAMKRDNYVMSSFELEAFPNPNANVGAGNPWFEYFDGAGTGL